MLLGRFLGPVRSTVPVVAGVVKMPHGPFQIANILSALLWVPALLLPGYLAGGRLTHFDFEAEHFAMMALGLCLVPLLLGWLAIRFFNKPRQRHRTMSAQRG